MTTIILTKYKVLTTGVEGGHKYLTTKIFYGGLEFDLPIFFKDKVGESLFSELPTIALTGQFKEEVNPLTIALYETEEVALLTENNWLTFFSNYFLNNNVDTLTISEYTNGYSISTNLEHYNVWASVSKDKLVVNKIEFGRFLPLEKPEYKRKSTSWTKGVFVNDKNTFIEFLQTSWDGEEGKKYCVEFTDENQQLVTDFLTIPFCNGWTEFDYRLNKNKFYKARGRAKFNDIIFENTFTLLDIGEQDIPFGFIDKFDQWLRTKWSDSSINKFRRSIDETIIKPIKSHS